MRFQALMPDVLHWLGIQKIDNMISMVSSRVIKRQCRGSTDESLAVRHETRRYRGEWHPDLQTLRYPRSSLASSEFASYSA